MIDLVSKVTDVFLRLKQVPQLKVSEMTSILRWLPHTYHKVTPRTETGRAYIGICSNDAGSDVPVLRPWTYI